MAKKRRNRSRDYIEDVPIGALLILLFAAWSYIKEFWYIFLIIAVAVIAVVILIKVKKEKRKKGFAIEEIGKHTSEFQSLPNIGCRLLLSKKHKGIPDSAA